MIMFFVLSLFSKSQGSIQLFPIICYRKQNLRAEPLLPLAHALHNPMLHHPSPALPIRPLTRSKKDSSRKKEKIQPQKIKDLALDKDLAVDKDVDVDKDIRLWIRWTQESPFLKDK